MSRTRSQRTGDWQTVPRVLRAAPVQTRLRAKGHRWFHPRRFLIVKYPGEQAGDWDGHLVLLYQAESQRRSGLSMWLRRGLELGSKILYIEPPLESPERSLSGVLRHDAEVRAALDRGQIQVLLADETAYDPAWQASVVEDALEHGYPSVRWSAEATTAWEVMPREQHVDIERATDDLCRSQPLSVMCQYAVDESIDDLGHVCRVHGAGLRERLFHASRFPGGLAVAGEIDRSNHDILRSLLSATTSGTEQDHVVVDLRHLDFLDVEGARSLIKGTAHYRERGGRVRVEIAGSLVGTVVRLLGVDRAPGMLLRGE